MKSFKFWFVILVIGVALMVFTPAPIMMKSMPKSANPPTASIYVEMKFWGSTIGQIMAGIGGLGVIVKAFTELLGKFKRKKP